MFFGAADRILRELQTVRDVRVVHLRLAHLDYLDATGAQALTEVVTELERDGITVLISGVRDDHIDLVTKVGVVAALRDPKHLFLESEDAITHARHHAQLGEPAPLG